MTDLVSIIFLTAICALTFTPLGARAQAAPVLTLAAGAAAALAGGATSTPGLATGPSALFASAGLGLIGFACAAQIRVMRFPSRCPVASRLTFAGAPLYFIACALAAFVMLPQLSFAAACLLGASLMLNGAAFDRRVLAAAPAPAAIKAAVRSESAAIVAFGAPLAVMAAAAATAARPDEPLTAPLLAASVALLKGFAIGGVFGLVAGSIGRLPRLSDAAARKWELAAAPASAVIAFGASLALGGEPVVAATAAGLVWGQSARAGANARGRLRRAIERTVTPLAYFGFGCLMLPRLYEADLLALVYAFAAVTLLRAGPRLAALQRTDTPRESQAFLAWYGGAPGVASALFLMSLTANPAIIEADAVLAVGALCVVGGVVAARMTSRPLVNIFLRQTALANRRRAFAS